MASAYEQKFNAALARLLREQGLQPEAEVKQPGRRLIDVLVGGLPGNGQDGFGNRCSVLVGQAGHQAETELAEQGGPVYQDDADYQDGYRAGRAGLNYRPDISTAWWSGWNDGHLMACLKCPDDYPGLSGTAVSNGLLETDIGKETDKQVLSITRQDRKETKK